MEATLDLNPELAASLQVRAQAMDMSLEELVTHLLQSELKAEEVASVEDALLQQINQGMSEAFWEEYHELIRQRETETLNTAAQQRLIHLSDELETAHARRMEHLLALARLREVSLPALMDSLDLNLPHA